MRRCMSLLPEGVPRAQTGTWQSTKRQQNSMTASQCLCPPHCDKHAPSPECYIVRWTVILLSFGKFLCNFYVDRCYFIFHLGNDCSLNYKCIIGLNTRSLRKRWRAWWDWSGSTGKLHHSNSRHCHPGTNGHPHTKMSLDKSHKLSQNESQT